MAATIVSFRWLEILEKEFDKNFVDLDLLIGDLDAEEPDFVHSARQKLAGLSSCFAQLTHKAQTIFQNSAKVEAELVDLRTELVTSKTRQEVLEEDSRSLLLQLHSLQLDRLPSNQNPEQYKEKIETALKLSPSKSPYSDEITFRNNSEVKKLKNELLQYQSENIILRNSILALHSEVYGARLAAKYLDKELAGRIQQLQLLGKEMRTDVRDKLWRQLESEILLHRHKTVIRACRNRTNHEFISADSRILHLTESDDPYLRGETFLRRGDSLLFRGCEGKANGRRRRYDPGKKSESDAKLNPVTALIQNNKNSFSNNSNTTSGTINNINNNIKNTNDNSNVINVINSGGGGTGTGRKGITREGGEVEDTETEDRRNNNSDYLIDADGSQVECDIGKGNAEAIVVSNADGSGENSLKSVGGGDVEVYENGLAETKEEADAGSVGKVDEDSVPRHGSSGGGVKGTKESIRRGGGSDAGGAGEEFLCAVGEKRTVIVKRQLGQGLGISITGGREHGVPILISELEVGGPAYECKNLFVGDAILKVNDVSLENTSHFEAVKILTNLETNNVKLLVQFIAVDTDEENSLSEDLYGYRYRFFDTEVMDSSDALGLHPVHSNSAHTPTAPRTPDLNRNSRQVVVDCCPAESKVYNSSFDDVFVSEVGGKTGEDIDEEDEAVDQQQQQQVQQERPPAEPPKSPNLIDIETEITKEETEKLKIDLFGFRFQTDIRDLESYGPENLLDDFLVKKPDSVRADTDLIQIEITDSKAQVGQVPAPPPPPPSTDKKFEYVDENIFSGLEDHSILDNIMKSFSEDDYSYLETMEKEKNATSDSGLEVCLSGSDLDGDKACLDGDKNYLNDWTDNVPERVELKTLQQIFDRSFSSNLSSPRGSTSFDDDILSTEHSDEKSNSAPDLKNRGKDVRSGYGGGCGSSSGTGSTIAGTGKKMQKYFPTKGGGIAEEAGPGLKKCFVKPDDLIGSTKSESANGKKVKRTSSDTVKRNKAARKSKETLKKDERKLEKRKNSKESDAIEAVVKSSDSHKKKEVNFKMTDRFEENLIEYNVKTFDSDNRLTSPSPPPLLSSGCKLAGKSESTGAEDVTDELEETRKLSRRYGLKIPGKGVRTDNYNSMVVMSEVISPDRCVKALESHLKHFKPVLDGTGKSAERDTKTRAFRYSRYESFGDPDFGTPV